MKNRFTLQIIFAVIFLFIFESSFATHLVGGYFTYTRLNNNTYHIKLTLYRDCNSQAFFDGDINNSNIPFASFGMFEVTDSSTTFVDSLQLISPVVTQTPIFSNIINPFAVIPPGFCMEEGVYEADIFPPDGDKSYMIVYQRCCRNNAITNLTNPGDQGTTYSIILPPYNSVLNSSPQFKSYPPLFICSNMPLLYDHSATDADGDSLVYSLCDLFTGGDQTTPAPNPPSNPPYTNITWGNGYSFSSPLGSDSFAINSATGLLTCIPTHSGQYLVGVCVSEYRNGQLLGEYKRDFQFAVISCEPTPNSSQYIPRTFDSNLGYGTYKVNGSSNYIDFSGLTFYNPPPTNIPLKIHWDYGDLTSNSDTSIQLNPNYTYPDTGIYMINVSVSKDVLGETFTVKGKGLIKIGFDTHKTDFTFQKDNNNNVSFFDNTYSSPTSLTHWEWDFGDGQKSYQQNPIHQYQYPAQPYSVKLITQNQFGSIDSITKPINIYPLSASTLVTENISIHINTQELSIEFPYVLMGTNNVSVYDGIGKLVMKDALHNQSVYKKTFAFSTGVYFLKISNESGIHFTSKCIVH